jgi:cytosine/adenosine deaminase-related metal-dependent hydrolase
LAYQPLNSAARQLVFSETGRGVHTVMVDGRIVLSGGNLTTLDERAFRLELAEVMKAVDRDYAELAARQQPAVTFLLKANRNLKGAKMGPNRMISDGSN